MKFLLLSFFSLVFFVSNAQTWTDSLFKARQFYRSGDYETALKYYNNLDKSKPANIDLSSEIGQAAYKSGDVESAQKKFENGLNNKESKVDKAKSYHNLGNSMMSKKDYQAAVNYYKEALRNNPGDEETRYNLSEAIRKLQKNDQNNNNNKNNQDNQSDNNQNDDKNKSNKDQSQNQNNPSNNQNSQQNPADKPNNSVERLLDQLNKKDAANNRKYDKNKGGMMSNTKDW
jgi:Ca-activated chloride channel family protein